jgi:hypothetical protein
MKPTSKYEFLSRNRERKNRHPFYPAPNTFSVVGDNSKSGHADFRVQIRCAMNKVELFYSFHLFGGGYRFSLSYVVVGTTHPKFKHSFSRHHGHNIVPLPEGDRKSSNGTGSDDVFLPASGHVGSPFSLAVA